MNKTYEKAIFLVEDTNSKVVLDLKEFYKIHYKIEVFIEKFDQNSTFIEQDKKILYYLYLSDKNIKIFLQNQKEVSIDISILPKSDNLLSQSRYGISKDIYEAIDDSLDKSLRINDQLLLCNENIVFEKVSIGDVQNLNKTIYKLTLFENIKEFFKTLKNLKYKDITFETQKEQKGKLAASGIMVLEDYTIYNNLKTNDKNSFHDGKLNAFFIAPKSVLSYIYYLLIIFLYHRFSIGNLSRSIGFVSSSKLKLETTDGFDFILDDSPMSARSIQLEVFNTQFTISYGKSFQKNIQAMDNNTNDNESVSVAKLPKGEIGDLLVAGKVPFFKKASDEDMKDTLISIKDSSKLSMIFVTLMILSSLLATVGIYQDSTPSVIGAMILAPLMAPIVSLSMGMARSDRNIIKNSSYSLGFGIFITLFFSSLLTLFLPLDMVTSQISSRVNPNLLDLFVAVFSGVAGAYASAKEEVAKSLAGVAIAVALVPPLCVTGIGIGWGDISIVYGSLLLFLTNLFGVILAASLTFVLLGFAPIHRAKKGLVLNFIFFAIISIPLIISFYSLILQSNDYSKLNHLNSIKLKNQTVYISDKNIKNSTKDFIVLECVVSSFKPLDESHYKILQKSIQQHLGKKVKLEVISKVIVQ